MQSLEPANDELDYMQLGFPGDVTEFEEEVEVELCDGEAETDIVETQALENQTVDINIIPKHQTECLNEQLSGTCTNDRMKEQQKQSLCIHQRLRHIYQEELLKSAPIPFQSLRRTSHLLEKLVEKESLNMVVLTLYPLNKGYCLFVCTADGTMFQESRQPYTQDLLLDYIDNEELPPPFLNYWEQTFPQLFYSGCVIAQVRDLRYGLPGQTRFVLLKPHTQSLINDINLLTMEDIQDLSVDEKLGIESALVNSVQGPLCLDPSPYAGLRRFHAHRTHHTFNTSILRNIVHKQTQVICSRKRKIDQTVVRCNQHLAEFIENKKQTHSSSTNGSVTVPNVQFKEPEGNSNIIGSDLLKEVNKLARAIERPPESSECTPKLVEQYILETERPPNTTYHIKLTILQRPSNCEYLGHLYVDKEYKEGESNGASCRFSLGTRSRANHYIEQFTEIFTEEGRKSVRITHLVPGQPARVTCTDGMVEREAAKNSSNLRVHNHPKQKILQVLSGKPTQQVKVQKSQKETMSGVNLTLNGLLSSLSSPSSSHQSNGNLLNGEVPVTPVSSPSSPQVNKTSLMTNPAISALANSFRNSVQQYQQAAAAAAAKDTIGSSSSTISSTTVAASSANSKHNTAILTLLNNAGSSNNQALNHLLTQPQQQHKIVSRKMTITNLLNSRLRQPTQSSQANSTSVRVPLSTLATQLTSAQNQTLSISASSNNNLQPTISVQTINPNTFRPLKQGSVQTLSNIQSLTSSLPSASGVQSLGNLQTMHRLSGTKETSSSNSGGQSVPTSSLGLSMPGLSALLAGTPSAEDTSPVDRISNTSQAASLNLSSLQASMSSIPGLQNVQVSIPGLPVPISVSLSVSTPHIVTASSLPSATMVSSNVTLGGPNTTATMVITNSNSAQLITPGVKSGTNQQNFKPSTSSASPALSSVQSIQLVGVPRQRLTGNKPALSARGVITAQRHVLKVTPSNSVRNDDIVHTGRVECGQVVALPSHQQLQLALQKQPHLQFQQCIPQQVQSSALAVKHRRRSSAADPKQ